MTHKDILLEVSTACELIAAAIAEANDSGNDGPALAIGIAMETIGPRGGIEGSPV